MKTKDTLVQEYLAAVERESAALPPASRQELIADLSEHIQVALAERPGSIREILHEVGDPRTIAATALQELGNTPDPRAHEPRKPRRPRSPAWLPIVLLLTSEALTFAGGNEDFRLWTGLFMEITAIVMVWRSRHWTVGEKWIGLALASLLPAFTRAAWNLLFFPDFGDSDAARWTVVALVSVMTVVGAGWLWRTKRP
ncbi:HAAS signaling domain-containing protein [Streptomyces sp. NPDC048639]|uniref:HAAS signaling domain-containing protein n=1 Tax=Streptomyces sp. NPDC048639 TaxID=3365581 RepID=UPI00371F23F0